MNSIQEDFWILGWGEISSCKAFSLFSSIGIIHAISASILNYRDCKKPSVIRQTLLWAHGAPLPFSPLSLLWWSVISLVACGLPEAFCDDDGDDIYIMVKCLCVCNENAYFRIQKIWSFLMFIATFHTQRNWPFLLFPGTFRTQRIWSFPCFLRLLCSKDLVISHVYRHFPNSKVSWNSKTTKSLEVFKEFGQFSCF